MTFSARVASSHGTLLEMSFQDIATGESIFAKTTSVWSHTGVCTAVRLCSYSKRVQGAYGVTDDVSDVLHGDNSLYNAGTDIFLRRLLVV